MMLLLIQLLRAALKQVLVALISERLLKDVLVAGLEKLAKRTDSKIDDQVLEVVRRALYPDYEAGEPLSLEKLDSDAKKLEKDLQ